MIVERIWTGNSLRNFNYLVACPETGEALAIDPLDSEKTLATARLREAKREGAEEDEIAALEHVISLFEAEASAKKAAKEARAALGLATVKQYSDLSEDDVRQLVLDAKWHATVADAIYAEVRLLAASFVGRVTQLAARYQLTVADLDDAVAAGSLSGRNDRDDRRGIHQTHRVAGVAHDEAAHIPRVERSFSDGIQPWANALKCVSQ